MEKSYYIIFLIFSIFTFAQNADEKEIYSLIINSFPEKNIKINNKIFRLNYEGNPDEKDEYKIFMKRFLFLRKSTYKDFIQNNKVEKTINNDFNSDKNIIVDSKGKESLIFSNLGFDYSKSQALVQYCKNEIFLALFEKKNGKWFLKEKRKLQNLLSEYYDNH